MHVKTWGGEGYSLMTVHVSSLDLILVTTVCTMIAKSKKPHPPQHGCMSAHEPRQLASYNIHN